MPNVFGWARAGQGLRPDTLDLTWTSPGPHHADDGVIEAVMFPGHPGWDLGVQWHPEDMADSDRLQAELFGRFVAAARDVATSRGAVRTGR